MGETIRQVDYFYVQVPHKAGEAARARLKGQLAGLLGLPKVLIWRRSVQSGRMVLDGEIDRLLVCD